MTAPTLTTREVACQADAWRTYIGYPLACILILTIMHAGNTLDSDEGVILNGAWHLANGRRLYIDFIEIIPPASFYLVSGIWSVLGANFWSAKLTSIILLTIGAWGIYLLAALTVNATSRAVRPFTLWCAPIIFAFLSAYWPSINHNTFNIVFLIICAHFVMRSITKSSLVQVGWAGALAGTAGLFLLHRTCALILATLAIGIFLLIKTRQTFWAKWILSFSLPAFALPASMLLFWSPEVLFENLIAFPATRYIAVNRVDLTIFVLASLAVAGSVWQLRRQFRVQIVFLLVLQVMLLGTSLHRPDINHITLTLFPIISLLPVLLPSQVDDGVTSRIARSYLISLMIAMTIPTSAIAKARFLANAPESLNAIRFIRENCKHSSYIYAGPFAPGVYFETKKLNASRYSILITNFNTETQFREAKQDLAHHAPGCIFTAYRMVDKFGHTKENVLDTYLIESFNLVFDNGIIQVRVAPSAHQDSENAPSVHRMSAQFPQEAQ